MTSERKIVVIQHKSERPVNLRNIAFVIAEQIRKESAKNDR